MEGTDPGEKLQSTYWEALKKNWMVWPAVQAVNFKFVPLEHRVLVVNVVSLGEWNLLTVGGGEGREGRGKERRGAVEKYGRKRGRVLTCVSVCAYRMELLLKLREQPGREREDRTCARQGAMNE